LDTKTTGLVEERVREEVCSTVGEEKKKSFSKKISLLAFISESAKLQLFFRALTNENTIENYI
jgi:hypothetical protein